MGKVNPSGEGPSIPRKTLEAADQSGSIGKKSMNALSGWVEGYGKFSLKTHTVKPILSGGKAGEMTRSTTATDRVGLKTFRTISANNFEKKR